MTTLKIIKEGESRKDNPAYPFKKGSTLFGVCGSCGCEFSISSEEHMKSYKPENDHDTPIFYQYRPCPTKGCNWFAVMMPYHIPETLTPETPTPTPTQALRLIVKDWLGKKSE